MRRCNGCCKKSCPRLSITQQSKSKVDQDFLSLFPICVSKESTYYLFPLRNLHLTKNKIDNAPNKCLFSEVFVDPLSFEAGRITNQIVALVSIKLSILTLIQSALSLSGCSGPTGQQRKRSLPPLPSEFYISTIES